jgi:NADH-quinone oxidoreductase subunit J
MINSILFYIIAAFVVFMALKMVLSSDLVHSALFMAGTFLGIAFIYILLQADYMAIVQIMVYVGAISVLFIFGVMLTKRNDMAESNNSNKYETFAGIVAIVFYIVMVKVIISGNFVITQSKNSDSTIGGIANLLLNNYPIAFEASSVLLLVATIGAIIIGKGVKQQK